MESDPTQLADVTMLRARQRVGRVLRGKWHLDDLLGVGGMAAVYAATHRNGKRAAIKMLHPELVLDGHVRSRFLKEGYAANKVDHPGAVQVLDDDTNDDGSLYLVMELLEGESLEGRQKRLGRLAPDEVLAAADQLLDVLASAHEKRIIHRDIKPENVFLTSDGVIKVLDFGLARLHELSTASTATRAGTTMGTPAFMPPEQARGLWDEVDGRSDLWAVGAAMFALLTGRLVHEARTTNEELLAAMTQPAPSLASVAPDVPQAVATVVDRALAFAREDRFPDARTMQEAVRQAYHHTEGAPISSHPKLTVPPEARAPTLASAEPPGATTGGAVVSGRTGMPLLSVVGLSRRKLAIGGAVAAVAVVALVVVVALVGHRGAVASGPSAASSAAPEKPASSASAVAVAPASTPEPILRPSASPKPGATPATSVPVPRPSSAKRKVAGPPKTQAAPPVQRKPARKLPHHGPAPITTQQNW